MIISIQELKNKFLKTNYFIDNEYLDLYLDLININLNTKKEKYKTSRHHIFPIALSKILKLDIDNSDQNLVNLLHKDHLLSHYYLALCSLDEFKYKMCCALYFLSGHIITYNPDIKEEDLKIFLNNLDEYQKLQEYYKREASVRNKGKKIPKEIV